MYNPEKLGRIARTNNFEAMALMKAAKRHSVEMRRLVYILINDAAILPPKEIIMISTRILHEADLANSATDDVFHHLLQNEGIFAQGADRGPYNTKDTNGN